MVVPLDFGTKREVVKRKKKGEVVKRKKKFGKINRVHFQSNGLGLLGIIMEGASLVII